MMDISDLPCDITQQILYFRDFLNTCWSSIKILMEHHDWKTDPNFLDDWITLNWGFLVGRELLGEKIYLLPLKFDRIKHFPDSKAYSKVLCKIGPEIGINDWIQRTDNYKGEELLVFSFFNDKREICPPFDFVEVRTYDTKKAYIIPIHSCRFFLAEIWDLSPM